MMLTYQRDSNVVPGPDTSNIAIILFTTQYQTDTRVILHVRRSILQTEVTTAADLVLLGISHAQIATQSYCHIHNLCMRSHGDRLIIPIHAVKLLFTMTGFGSSHCCGAHDTAQLSQLKL